LGITVATSTVTSKGDDGTSAFAGVEATAAVSAVRVGIARAGDELGSTSNSGDVECGNDGQVQGENNGGDSEPHCDRKGLGFKVKGVEA